MNKVMHKWLRATASFLGLLALFVSVWSVNSYVAQQHTKPAATPTLSAKPITGRTVYHSTVDMAKVPTLKPGASNHQSGLPALEGNQQAYNKLKQAAAHSTAAPHASHTYPLPANSQPNTPSAGVARIQGMTDASTGCNCQPPDQALAVSASWIFQGVNDAFAVYTKLGIQPGWPRSAQRFFGVPNPPNNCAAAPFLSDPRAFYDVNDGRFWVAMLQVEGAFGIAPNCPETSLYWVAVSQTGNPNLGWNAYAFDMIPMGTNLAADYTQFGFDNQAITFSGNLLDQTGTTFITTEEFSVTKTTMEKGLTASPFGFTGFNVGGFPVDTVQPVEVESSVGSLFKSTLLINSLNINFGGGFCSSGCRGIVVWAIANPGTASQSMTGIEFFGATYSLAPSADEPGCTGCIETLDTRISGTPIYHAGMISFALETAVNNGSQIVPGILWGQIAPTLNSSGALAALALYQEGYFNYGSDNAASFGAVMPNNDGDLMMVLELMGGSINPKVVFVTRRVTFFLGLFSDLGQTLKAGAAPTFDTRWGDYEATSYDHPSKNDFWFAGEYAASNGDWATEIGSFSLKDTDP